MTQSERFQAIFNWRKPDRMPVFFFGYWNETKERWLSEGFTDPDSVPGMDPDWEAGMWDCYDMVWTKPLGPVNGSSKTVGETNDYVIVENEFGDIVKKSKIGTSVDQILRHALSPERASWERFKAFLDPGDKRRYGAGWESRAGEINSEDRVHAFMGGSLYGWLRNMMGVEYISYLMYDDIRLLSDMVEYLTEYFIALFTPVLEKARFDFVYFFEDCCGKNGPLFSPDMYKRVFDAHYRRLICFYKENGVPLALVDSDGNSGKLIPCWLESGFDIIFPIENGVWKGTPKELRKKFGKGLRMFGGVDKHVIPKGEAEIRAHLLSLKPEADEGGFIPLPDHRIPPDCSYQDFLTYVRIFNEVFN